MRWGHTVEPSGSIVQPDDDIISAQQVRPDQVVVAIIVDVTREERAQFAGKRVETQQDACLRSAEMNLNVLITSATTKRCYVDPVVAVEIREREGLSEVEETGSV